MGLLLDNEKIGLNEILGCLFACFKNIYYITKSKYFKKTQLTLIFGSVTILPAVTKKSIKIQIQY